VNLPAPTTEEDDTRTYTATSEQDADAWLDSLAHQEGRPVVGAEFDSRTGGRIRITARLGDVTPADEHAMPAAGPALCGSCGAKLPVRTGGAAPAVLRRRLPVPRGPSTAPGADPLRAACRLVEL
jgi:hypothetical protein